MRKGKIPYNSLIRAVLRAPFPQRETDAVSRDSAFLGSGQITSAVNTTVYGGEGAEALAFYRSLNSLLASGAKPETLMLSLTLPESMTEPETAAMMRRFTELAKQEGLRLAGGHTMYAASVSRPVLSCIVSGQAADSVKKPEAGDALIMTGYAGRTGSALLMKADRERLKSLFSPAFLSPLSDFRETLSVRAAAEILAASAAVMHDVSEGGIFGALYEFAEGQGIGFTADPYRIPVLQETVEVCEVCLPEALNPYSLLSTGCLLAAVRDGETALAALAEQGIPAEQIGVVTKGSQKILVKGDEQRFLDRPEQDGVFRAALFG